MQLGLVEVEFFPYGETDMTKLMVACRNFANAPKMEKIRFEVQFDLSYRP
jgi:hypothetical protein